MPQIIGVICVTVILLVRLWRNFMCATLPANVYYFEVLCTWAAVAMISHMTFGFRPMGSTLEIGMTILSLAMWLKNRPKPPGRKGKIKLRGWRNHNVNKA